VNETDHALSADWGCSPPDLVWHFREGIEATDRAEDEVNT